jgi:uncharacterized protein (DUF2267 family)
MEIDEFYDGIEGRLGGVIEVEAAEAARAVLGALSLRLTHEEALELGGELPDEVADLLAFASGAEGFDRDAFIEDVASRLDLDDMDAERVSLAVLGAIREALEPSPEQVIETLPSDLARLMQPSE